MRILLIGIYLLFFFAGGCTLKKKEVLLPHYEKEGGFYFKIDHEEEYATTGKVYLTSDTSGYYFRAVAKKLFHPNSKNAQINIQLKNIDKGTYTINSSLNNVVSVYIYNDCYSNNPYAEGEMYEMGNGDAGWLIISENNSEYVEGTFQFTLNGSPFNPQGSKPNILVHEGKFKVL